MLILTYMSATVYGYNEKWLDSESQRYFSRIYSNAQSGLTAPEEENQIENTTLPFNTLFHLFTYSVFGTHHASS